MRRSVRDPFPQPLGVPMPDDLAGHIEDAPLADALGERYLAYALSTIMSRSLPDVRDGLKPVHRRLVYAIAPTAAGIQRPRSRNARAWWAT